MSHLLFLLYLLFIQLHHTFSYYFKFNDQEELFSQLNNTTFDYLVVIGYQLTPKKYQDLVLELYSKNKKELLTYISSNYNNETEDVFNYKIHLFEPNFKGNISEKISEINWYFKVKWMIYANIYTIKNDNSYLPKIGSTKNYINFLNDTTLNIYFLNVLNKFPEVNSNITLFEEEIMNQKLKRDKLITFLLMESNINFLKELAIRVELYSFNNNHNTNKKINCDELEKIINFSSADELRSHIIDKVDSTPHLSHLKIMDDFLFYILNDGHTFIDYKSKVKKLPFNTLTETALHLENYHKKVFNIYSSFVFLNDYVNQLTEDDLIDYILSELRNFPELTNLERFADMNNRRRITVVSAMTSMLENNSHPVMLRWAFNLKQYQINNNKDIKTTIDEFSDYIFYNTTIELKKEIIRIVTDLQDQFKTVDTMISFADPSANVISQFERYLRSYPQLILAKYLKNIMLYDFERTKKEKVLSDPYTLDKDSAFSFISYYLGFRKELLNFQKFDEIIDVEDDGDIYGSLSDYAYVTKKEVLKHWVNMIENYHRWRHNLDNIAGSCMKRNDVYFPLTNTTKIDEDYEKEELVNLITYYATLNSELNKTSQFDKIVGTNSFHQRINKMPFDELSFFARKLFRYYNIKNYFIREYDENTLPLSFDQFSSNKENIEKIRRFIFRTITIFPEVTLDIVFNEILSLPLLNRTINHKQLTTFLITVESQQLLRYAYACSRYQNATLPWSQRLNLALESFDNNQLIKLITQTVDSNEELTKDWNFARLLNQEEHLLYGGPIPFLYRQHYSRLQDFLDNARNKYTNDNYISDNQFIKLSKDEQVKYLSYIITLHSNDFIEIKQVEDFLSLKHLSIFDFSQQERDKIIAYALVCEYFIDKKGLYDSFGGIHKSINERTRRELEDYIERTYDSIKNEIKSINDFEIWVRLLGYNNKERNLSYYSS